MENSIVEEKMALIPKDKDPRKGGLKTMPFIIVNEAFERVASYGLMPNMIFYLMENYRFEAASGSTILFLWSAMSNGLSIFGAFLSDSFMGRYLVISLGSFFSLIGMILLWLTAMVPQLTPPPCDRFTGVCSSSTAGQLAILFSSFGLISLGAGCIRPCSIAFGADQLDNEENPNNESVLQSFFNWYYAATGLSTIIAFTVIVYVQDNLGWKVGFAIPAILMFFSALMFLVGSSQYVKVKASTSLFTGFVQVLAAAFRNRKLSLSHSGVEQYCHSDDSELEIPTDNLRCLNRACVITDPDRDVNPDGSASNPWRLCTVDQVESLKALLRVIPIWSTGIMMQINLNQNSFATLQAKTMDRQIFNFELPAGSLNVFLVLTLTIWLTFYDRILLPLLAKFTGKQRGGPGPKVRIGIGLLIPIAARAMSAVVETIRKRAAIAEGLEEQPDGVVNMSVAWLLPPIILLGLAEAFNSIGQIEFYYSQFPKSMSSIAVAIFTFGTAVADMIGSGLVDVVDRVTSRGGEESWLSSNLNKGRLDDYYWLITALSMINFVYFLVCCWAYGPTKDEKEERLLE
ncbi:OLIGOPEPTIDE TRANSPORTER-RELATED [Salix purpurea]|uniref:OLIGOPEPTIDE TRANSPORTER-RELATED n=1 Tax=Salix purpurea TaxID=77065 RepID=A0A9Q0Q126_SALPP|nr:OLIGOPEPTIDE TRANSPORTER-RELATED [Salix purpurea]